MAGIACAFRLESQREYHAEPESCQGVRDTGVAETDDGSCAEEFGEEGIARVSAFLSPSFSPPFFPLLSFAVMVLNGRYVLKLRMYM